MAAISGIQKFLKVESKIELTLKRKSQKLLSPFDRGSLAQPVEHFTFNEGVDGSNPSRATISLPRGEEAQTVRRSHRLVA